MSARPLPAVGSTRREASVAFAANLLVAVIFAGQNLQGGLNDSTTETVIHPENISRPE